MTITLNNRTESFEADSHTIAELIKIKNFTFKLLVTKLNGKLIKRDQRAITEVKDGDTLIILHLISCG